MTTPESLFLGIDLGTSGVRASVLDSAGEEISHSAINTPAPEVDGVRSEQASQLWLDAVSTCLGEICRLINPGLLRAIAVDGTSSTLLLCDDRGNALTPGLMYNDARALEQAQRIRHNAPADCGAHGASSSLAKLLWLRDTMPQLAEARACHQADFVTSWLGGHVGLCDENNGLKLGYDSVNRRWPAWMQTLGISPRVLPEVVPPGTVIGTIKPERARQFGISNDCVIVAGTTDSIAALIASGANQVGDAVTSLGSTLVLKLISEAPVFNAEYGIYSHRLGKHWLVGGASNSGGRVLRRFFTQQQLDDMTPHLQPDSPTGLDYYPLISAGERFPVNDPHKTPVLEPRPDEDVKFFQGMLEGMTRIEADGYAKLQLLGASLPKRVFTAGGGSKNQGWCRMRERALGVPVITAVYTEASVGAARLAHQGWRQSQLSTKDH